MQHTPGSHCNNSWQGGGSQTHCQNLIFGIRIHFCLPVGRKVGAQVPDISVGQKAHPVETLHQLPEAFQIRLVWLAIACQTFYFFRFSTSLAVQYHDEGKKDIRRCSPRRNAFFAQVQEEAQWPLNISDNFEETLCVSWPHYSIPTTDSLVNRWYLVYGISFAIVSLILLTGTYQPEGRHAALPVINRAARLWNKMSLAVATATIERDAIIATRNKTGR